MRSVFLFLLALAANAADFNRDIAPVLTARCLKCHGAALQLSGLDLRTREAALRGGAHGPALVPADPAKSPLYRMISGELKPAMPMDGKLTPAEIESFRAWIAEGAAWGTVAAKDAAADLLALENSPLPPNARDWWSFRPLATSAPPAPGHPIDAFVNAKLKDLVPAGPADRRTLIRRASLDLTGLPPTPSEVEAFVKDTSPRAWETVIDRLLASPHYGERWGRHWLDLARYADSNGFEHDFDRPNAYRYRDYVIRSFNSHKPYDQFLREQLAGDELPEVTHDTLTATGFLRNYAKVGFREKDNPEFRYEYLDDMIATVGRGLLGLTVQCARCHNHKFDPIPQRDYYRLQATLFGVVEVDHPLVSPAEAAAYQTANARIDAEVQQRRQAIANLEQPYRAQLLPAKYKRFPPNVQEAIATPEAQRTPGQVLLANQVTRTVQVPVAEILKIASAADLRQMEALKAEIAQYERQRPARIPMAMGITDGDYRYTPDGAGDEPAPGKGVKQTATGGSFLHNGVGKYQPPPAYFLHHGDLNSRGSEMQPGFASVASTAATPVALPPANGRTSGRRLALAEWLVSPENPLAARVIVNRVWHHHFGRGLFSSLDNVGKMGDAPTHPELLDYLARNFRENGWNFKQLHKLILTSAAYQRSSQDENPVNLAADPRNLLLWRYRAHRLEAEAVRDQILAVSGALRRELYGPAVFPPLAPEVLAQMKNGIWKEQAEEATFRRSVYVYRKRGLPFPMFEVFDLPDQNISCGGRAVSTVPTQSLTLMNNAFVLGQAKLFAARLREAHASPEAQIEAAYQLTLARPPQAEERRLALEYLRFGTLEGFAHVLLNLNEFVYLR
ncbi:MAG: PSD1 and planctomycete cytochrome C domain-containing protein [Bryobacteraceae bacterium]|nr:PSD1 and planctomycete cytochrome C domain-containing protein [Bryobacteraceae bacterium]